MRALYWITTCATVAALSGCGTRFMSLPAQPALDVATSAGPVGFYTLGQTHPPVAKVLGPVKYSVRIARGTDGREQSCQSAFAEALQKLRATAQERSGNAVINLKTSFHRRSSDLATDFACGVSLSAAALKVSGEVVLLDQP
ncbi:signal peptidase [Paraburkholderia bonniea]|uniref:signal peptidase n=1 Tax=Paraburkholderia bonniea TaxID=2152891 RepID=UPI0012928452|nr:signal peptidase [Paraburkholderia bonniea]WJF88880.1 signal peptidase [Paraburkholderia bonniea]WJF92196.1 signal peptidase [Paraburkholderia bonniea]